MPINALMRILAHTLTTYSHGIYLEPARLLLSDRPIRLGMGVSRTRLRIGISGWTSRAGSEGRGEVCRRDD
jgi:hypothetical protein